ncbi:MAG: hypothetical protein ACLGJB_03100 [Blastocatellia bacterium]
MKFEKFEKPYERDIGGGVAVMVKAARPNQSGLIEAKVEAWNGNLLYSNTVVLGREAERVKCRDAILKKVRSEKVRGAKVSEVTAFLLAVDSTLGDYFESKSNAGKPDDDHDADPVEPYCISPKGGFCWRKPTANGSVAVQLTNFTAEIKGYTVEDDGTSDTRSVIDIEAKLDGRVARFSVPAHQFGQMRWAIENLGPAAIIFPSYTDHARCAVQWLSKNYKSSRVITHTGWRKRRRQDDSIEHYYCHAGGAIGETGQLADINIKLSPELSAFKLPEPPQGDDLVKAIRASLNVLNAAPHVITYPLLASVYRAVIAACDFSLHLSGPSGAGKSEIAALAQQHFGASLDARHLPANWASTSNANEAIAFTLKNMVMVIDDFAPSGSTADIQRMHRDADRLLRGQGNQAGRRRMRADASLRAEKYPRCLPISTGEDVPRGKSLRARLLILEVGPDDIDFSLLTGLQKDASAGLLMSAMAGFIQWLAASRETLLDKLRDELAKYRDYATRHGMRSHARTPEIVANLAIGLANFLLFARESGVMTKAEKEAHWVAAWKAFKQAALLQARYQSAGDPVQVFLDLLQAAIASGRAYVAHIDGTVPGQAQAWGWRESGDDGEWRPIGRRIGWVDGRGLYLEKDASLAEVQMIGGQTGEPLSISGVTLHKRLHERGLLVTTEPARGTLHIRRKIEGMEHKVLHLSANVFSEVISTVEKPDISDIDSASDVNK